MVRALVVADEVDETLWCGQRALDLDVDVVLGAGDLPFAYLEHLADMLNAPVAFVPGNHDPDLTGFTRYRGLALRGGMPASWPGPAGGIDVDGRVATVAGLRIAGLGGSVRYREGPNQWTQRQQARRARLLTWRSRGRPVDVLLTHAPPRGLGDRDDLPHHGFDCLHRTVRRLRPRWLLHGHIHPYGEQVPDRRIGDTVVRNVVGAHVLDLGAFVGSR
ncbi:metallophosphoesterase family protein [Prauserella rugosa]|uniref:Icc-related predicted phosphoesterase n=1 Tax=Prauserella rugosa TaxID=43354 RepID=A0A660CGC6_9PSEU|nr:metallophosphoesterase [Prauserella rugosa]KID28975.1 putative phosphoesterase, ICC [Prauserella sp. Am3]KMS85887.1 metallophosphoesterase [Streptomyces regensis]TWH22492.1 Icc-related predicted phosphoesterase [Prauserella rugosa]